MKSYVVVEGPLDAAVMRTLLDAAGLPHVALVSGGGKSAAISLGKSIALSRGDQVAVVVDADTTDPRAIDEQQRTFSDLQGPAAPLTRLFLAKPTLEEDLFPSAQALVVVFKVALTKRQIDSFALDRKRVIRSLITTENGEARVRSHGRIDPRLAQNGFGHPLLKNLFGFLRTVALG